VQRRRRTDSDHARRCAEADPKPEAPRRRHPLLELAGRLQEAAAPTGRPGGREDVVCAEQQRAWVVAGRVPLHRGETQTRVGHDAVELLHQRRLRKGRQLPELHVRLERGRAEHLAVVRRRRDRVREHVPDPLPLVGEEMVARPAIARQELRGSGGAVGAGAGNGRHGSLLWRFVRPRM
jgi:hypothetical protein